MHTEVKEDWEPAEHRVNTKVNISGAPPLPRRTNRSLMFVPDRIVIEFVRTEGQDDWEFCSVHIAGDPLLAGGRVSKLRRYSDKYWNIKELATLPTWAVDIVNRATPRGD